MSFEFSQYSIASGQGQSVQISSDDDLESIPTQSPIDPSDQDEAPSEEPDQILERPDDERPNRYKGTTEEWREHTIVERGIAIGLDKMQATDLSRHLFNAYALKVRSDASESQLWKPQSYWTAWPLPPSVVPRTQEQRSQRHLSGKLLKLPSSRMELEEVIIAISTKEARDRVLRQMWMNAYGHALEPPDSKYDLRSHISPKVTRGRKNDGKQPETDLTLSVRNRQSLSPNTADRDLQEHTLPLAIPNIDPEFEVAILRPSARQTLASFNTLLMALHRSRRNLRPSARNARGPVSSPSRSSSTRSISRSTKSSVRERTTSRSTSVDSVTASRRRRHESSEDQGKEQKSNQRSRLRPRDWIDVLGIATLSRSFEPRVVERARFRVEKLMGEEM